MVTATGRRQEAVAGGRQHEVRVGLTDAQHAELAERAAAEKISIARFLVQQALVPQGKAVRALVFEILAVRRLVQGIANDLQMLAVDGETEGYDVDAHDLATREVLRVLTELRIYFEQVTGAEFQGADG